MGQNPWIGEVDVARAGFINVTINKTNGNKVLASLLQTGVQPPPLEKKLRVVVDFSSPNIAKEMHVGHLRYTYMQDSTNPLLCSLVLRPEPFFLNICRLEKNCLACYTYIGCVKLKSGHTVALGLLSLCNVPLFYN
jgi:hypothetical protein